MSTSRAVRPDGRSLRRQPRELLGPPGTPAGLAFGDELKGPPPRTGQASLGTEPGGLRRGCYHGPFGATLNLEPLARPPEPVRGGTEAAIWVHEVKPSLARILVTCRIAVAG